MEKTIAVIKGDGIGPEIIDEALAVLSVIEEKYQHRFTYQTVRLGGEAINADGTPLPRQTLAACRDADAVLLGAVGGPQWEHLPGDERPEKGLLGLRKGLGLYANLRPATIFPALRSASPLRSDLTEAIDFIVVRELIGGVYFGRHTTEEKDGELVATDVMSYSESEIERILHIAFQTARERRSHVTSVDKANVLDTSRLWRKTLERVAKEYPDVRYTSLYVDNAAMQIVRNPAGFDVLVTENLFGDILSDEASMITGSIGMIPSASLGEKGTPGLYEPIHGSAPDIAGQDKANPAGTILSAAMMLRYAFGLHAEADAVEQAVNWVLEEGLRTPDLAREGDAVVGCKEFGKAVCKAIE